MKKITTLYSLLLLVVTSTQAQEMNMQHMHGMNMQQDSTMHQQSHMAMHMPAMSSAYSKNLPMGRDGSGTSWLPDDAPMFGYMKHSGKWMFMFHGNLFIRYNKQDISDKGTRGGEKWDAPNFIMAMGQRKVGKHGLFHFSTMFSADAIIQGGSGYPLLFQTGESWQGVPLVDRQHPHDLFAEVSVGYSYALSKKSDLYVYLGYPGEPALGPVAFMHRPSSFFDPDAPITHHWEDGTHITFGVATVGYRYGKFKLEASSFTGREPDENRYNFDKAKFDSWSGRLSYNPSEHWALEVSHGFAKSPEALRPNEDVNHTIASAIYSYSFANDKYLNATAIWGLNQTSGQDGSNAAVLEASLKMKRLAVYTRYEWVQKSGEELNLDGVYYNPETLHPVNEITLGAGYDLFQVAGITIAAGAQATLYHADATLNSLYGQNPMAGEIYLHIYPHHMH